MCANCPGAVLEGLGWSIKTSGKRSVGRIDRSNFNLSALRSAITVALVLAYGISMISIMNRIRGFSVNCPYENGRMVC